MTTTLAPLPIEIQPHEINDNTISVPGCHRIHHQWVYRFPNGYGASVVRGEGTYGYQDGLYELAVIKFDGDEWHLNYKTYKTSVTNDVIGWLDLEDVAARLLEIAGLQS